jgi:GNAT superfamily N-acetyltransferase
MPLALVVPETAPLREAALALLYSPLPHGQRQEQVAETLAAVSRNELSLDNLVVALDGDQLRGAVLAVVRPGGAAFLWPPAVSAGTTIDDVSRALLQAIAARVDNCQVQFTQCLLEPGDMAGRATLEVGGFPFATELILLSRPVSTYQPSHRATEFSIQTYTPARHAAFSKIVERTYVGTLDCPILARIRGGEESLDAHRATGQFVPHAWRIYRTEGRDVGVLILAEHPERDTWEVAYLGVVPEARGRGIGRAILHDALILAKESGRSTIEIAVDSTNTPALRLYHSLSFTDLRRFAVHLRVRQ